MAKDIRAFTGPDGVNWGVEIKMPSASGAMVVFHHPGGKTHRLDRYAWYHWHGPEARSVTSRVAPASVMKSLKPEDIALLFRRSMPMHAGADPLTGHRAVAMTGANLDGAEKP